MAAEAAERKDVAARLQHWQADRDLAGVRDAEALARLPAEERASWQTFWEEVAALAAKARAAK